MMIYDVSKGFENSSIILADSGKMSITPDKTHLFLRLWNGESFENIRDAGASNMRNVPYRRESFSQKDIMLKFDANFNRMDEQGMRSQYVGKNMTELQASIDSMSHRVDSIGDIYGTALREYPYMGLRRYDSKTDNEGRHYKLRRPDVALARPVDVDSVFRGSSSGVRINYLSQALSKAERTLEEYKYKSQTMAEEQKLIRRHAIELQKKFTLSFACVIFLLHRSATRCHHPQRRTGHTAGDLGVSLHLLLHH